MPLPLLVEALQPKSNYPKLQLRAKVRRVVAFSYYVRLRKHYRAEQLVSQHRVDRHVHGRFAVRVSVGYYLVKHEPSLRIAGA